MVAVPTLTGVTIPEVLTVATEVLLLLHVPPVAVSLKVDGVPIQRLPEPVIVPGSGIGPTVMKAVATAKPQAFDTE